MDKERDFQNCCRKIGKEALVKMKGGKKTLGYLFELLVVTLAQCMEFSKEGISLLESLHFFDRVL